MRSYLRRLPLIFCLTLSAAVVVVWVRSYVVADRYRWVSLHQENGNAILSDGFVVTGMGGFGVYTNYWKTSDPLRISNIKERVAAMSQMMPGGYASSRATRYPVTGNPDDSILSSLGFFYRSGSEQGETFFRHRFGVTLPIWSIFGVTMAYPMAAYVAGVVRRQKEDRLALGLCPRCGIPIQDQSQRCPGCDRPLPAVVARHA